jgi:hypothetical protein
MTASANHLTAISAVAATLFALAADNASAAQPQAGQWKVVTKTTITGGPPGIPADMRTQENTQLYCLTPEQVKDPTKVWMDPQSSRSGGEGCTNKNSWNGTVLTIDSTCGGSPPTSVKGTMTFDTPTHYRGEMKSAAPTGSTPMQVAVTLEGQRVGECPR